MRRAAATCFLLLLLTSFTCAADATKAKNVILMIGDGMGFNCHIAGSYYRFGKLGQQKVETFPVHVGMTTFCQKKQGVPIPAGEQGYDAALFWRSPSGRDAGPNSVTTDSAAASTALHGGIKTVAGRIGMTDDKKPVTLISQIADAAGRATGAVTTVQACHATPAGFSAHNESRNNYGEIFIEQVEQSPLFVLIGVGHPQPTIGKGSDTEAYKYVGSEECWNKIVAESSQPPLQRKKFVRILSSRNSLPPVDGVVPEPGRDAGDAEKELLREYRIDTADGVPTLADVSVEALDLLARKNAKGFVLMIEGGAIDHANHARNIRRSVYEHVAFMKSVEAVCDWVEKNSSWNETLLIVTADHETGSIWGPDTYEDENGNGVYDEGDTFNKLMPVVNNGIGKLPGVQYGSGSHSNALVPLWAKGPGSTLFLDRVRGSDSRAAETWKFSGKYVDNTDVFNVMKEVLNSL